MNMRTIITLLVSLVLYAPAALYAQQARGRVSDKEGNPVTHAVIALLRKGDSTVVQMTQPDSAGHFVLDITERGEKLVRVEALGYKDGFRTLTAADEEQSMPDFVLEAAEASLEEVAVLDRKALLVRKTDRIIFNVAGSLAAAGGTALDAIRKVPGVLVRQGEQTIGLVGKSSVQVLINDRLLQLSGAELMAYLQAIPSERIERIEVITAPPSKYDAAGNSGLIHIVLKHDRNRGFSGAVRTGYEQATYGKGTAGANLNLRRGQFNIYGNIEYGKGANNITERLTTPYPAQQFAVKDTYRKNQNSLQYTLGADYELSRQHTLGIRLVGNNTGRSDASVSDIEVRKLVSAQLDSTMRTQGQNERRSANNLLDLGYTWKPDTAGTLVSLGASRLWFSGRRSNDFATRHYSDAFLTPTGAQSRNRTQGNQDIVITAAQADVTLPASFLALSFGGKLSFIGNQSDNLFEYYDYNQSAYFEDTAVSNAFSYTEKVQALYLNARKTLGKWELQAGLRGEFTQTSGYSRRQEQRNDNHYFSLFPTLYLQYHYSDNHLWNLNYSKRINRPGYRSLDPFRAYATPYHYNQGNPFLLPSFNHNVELSCTLQGQYTFAAFFQFEQNHSGSVWEIDSLRNITSGVSRNFADIFSYGINIMGSFRPAAWWELQVMLSGQVQHMQSKVYTATAQSYRLPTGYAGATGSFSLNAKKTLLAELSCYVLSKYREEFLEIDPLESVDIGFRALLFREKLTIGISGNDLLASQRANGIHIVTGQTIDNYFDTRNLRLSLTYKFGNAKAGNKKAGNNDMEAEQQRLR